MDDDPFEIELVGAPLDLRARLDGDGLEQLLQLVLGANELTGGERLEAHARGAGGLQAELGLERDARGRDREQPLACGLLELLPPEEDVAEAHRATRPAGPFPAPPLPARQAASRAAGAS